MGIHRIPPTEYTSSGERRERALPFSGGVYGRCKDVDLWVVVGGGGGWMVGGGGWMVGVVSAFRTPSSEQHTTVEMHPQSEKRKQRQGGNWCMYA